MKKKLKNLVLSVLLLSCVTLSVAFVPVPETNSGETVTTSTEVETTEAINPCWDDPFERG